MRTAHSHGRPRPVSAAPAQGHRGGADPVRGGGRRRAWWCCGRAAPRPRAHRRRLRPADPAGAGDRRSTRWTARTSTPASRRPRPGRRPPTAGAATAGSSGPSGACKKATIEVDDRQGQGPHVHRDRPAGRSPAVAPTGRRWSSPTRPTRPQDLQYSVTDVDRKLPMALLAGIFALAVVVVGRLRGVHGAGRAGRQLRGADPVHPARDPAGLESAGGRGRRGAARSC